ncbi:MAG TPA: PIG-L family deacetylase [Dongiaceae bacterium]|nr:PIG-L family deacetylase [Dongiaceae bacterium]
MSAPDDVLFVFAHQDDEVGAFSRIAFEVRAGHRVWCAFLTDGAKKVRPGVRDAESLRVLRRLGVAGEHVAFLADRAGRIADGTLVHNLQRARVMLLDWLRARAPAPARIYTLDWEGGHHDHDATHLVTLSVARDLGVADVFVYPFYNGWRRRPKLARVSTFIPSAAPVLRRRMSLRDSWRAACSFAGYPSQRLTWLALGPGFFVRTLATREERLRRADPRRVLLPPHGGVLHYENIFGVRCEDVLRDSAALRAEIGRATNDPSP